MERAGEQSFGEVLRRFRDRKKLTQQHLAKQIGVHRDSIGSWERGEYFPEIPTMLHELARVLDLNEDDKRLLFEVLYGTASMLPLYNLPEHNPYFTGREEVLTQLHTHLTAGKQVALIQTQAINGLGGIGKTQVAIEYAYRFREHYHDILWTPADSRETLMTSYLTLAMHLRLREREEREQHKVVEAVKRWLREHKGWLLILDNIEDLELVREFVPAPRQGAVVLTTRREETQPVARAIVLDTMPDEEGILLLLKRAGYLAVEASLETASPHNIEAARAIVHAVGGLPLALDQAGAYMTETRCSLSDYLDLFKLEQNALLQRRGTVPGDHPQSVTTTFALAFEQVQQKNEAAIELLKLCALLAPDAIPLELITQGAAHLGTILELVAADVLQLDQALEVLQAYSLVRRDGESRTLSIHRLVQAVLRDAMSSEETQQWEERTVRAVNYIFPEVVYETWVLCERYLQQAQICMSFVLQSKLFFPEAARLLDQLGAYLYARVRYAEAELPLKNALAIREQILGPEHIETASSLHNLTWLYRDQGKYEQAELLGLRALAIRERVLGSEHLDVATSLDSLVWLYYAQSKYEQAEPLARRCLLTQEKILGPEHLKIASSLNSLAWLHFVQGRYEPAELHWQRALEIRETALGPEHPSVAFTLNSLAWLYHTQGRYRQAELFSLRSLAIREKMLGPEHPDTATSLDSLVWLYLAQGQYEQAQPLALRSLAIREKTLGSDHRNVAASLDGLIELYLAQGQYEQAQPLALRSLAIREKTLASEHPDVAISLDSLATLYSAQGQYDQAEQLLQRSLAIRAKTFGPEHPDAATSLYVLAKLYQSTEQYEQAESLYQQALAIRERHLGSRHPETAELLHDFAAFQSAQGDRDEAASLYQRALAIREQALGPHHPKTGETRKRYASLLREMGQHEEAALLEVAQSEHGHAEEEREAN